MCNTSSVLIWWPGLVSNGYTIDTIASAPEAGDEGGLMTCLFVLGIRARVCAVLESQDHDEFKSLLCSYYPTTENGENKEAIAPSDDVQVAYLNMVNDTNITYKIVL